jgi:hypothetical protein
VAETQPENPKTLISAEYGFLHIGYQRNVNTMKIDLIRLAVRKVDIVIESTRNFEKELAC